MSRFAIWTLAALGFCALPAYFWHAPAKRVVLFLCVEYALLLPATIYTMRPAAKGAGAVWPQLPRTALLAGFLTLALAVSWVENHGELIPDELAYRFQAKIFATGHLTAPAPPGAAAKVADTPAPVYFENHIISDGRWFAKYPWGWPILLAGPSAAGIPWVANPLIGLCLLMLTATIAQRLYGSVPAALAVFVAVLSPYFWANCIGLMSHPACAAFLAAACLFCFDGLRTLRSSSFAWMFLMITAAFQVRPFTAAAIGAVLGCGALWFLRRERVLYRVLVLGILFGVICGASILISNKLYTHNYLLSPYALFQRTPSAKISEINFDVSQILHNITHQTRWAIQETTFYTFPFMWLLGGYAVWREREHPREARILAAVAVALLFAYLVQADLDVEFIGERYYFEGFFAPAILAARGLQILATEQKIAQRAMAPMLWLFLVLQLCQIALTAGVFWNHVEPYSKVRAATEALGGDRYTVFLTDSEPEFVAKHFNLNRPDWANGSQIFLVDPGVDKRDSWACLTGRPKWVAIGYDPAASKVTEEFGAARGCAIEARARVTSGR